MCCCHAQVSIRFKYNIVLSFVPYESTRITELLRETKVNQVHSVAMSANTHQKIVWLYVTVHKVAIVHEL